jgi:ABC-type glycerol-3-phosphate transport system permease component
MKQVSQYKKYSHSRIGNGFYFVLLVLLGLFTIIPMIYTVITSFKPLDELLAYPPKFLVYRPTFSNYVTLPTLLSNLKVPLARYIFNSIFTTVITTVLQVIVASMAAFSLSKIKLRGRKVIFLIIQFALLYNAYTLAIPQYIIFSKLKLINTYWIYILPHLSSSLAVFLIKQFLDDSIPDVLLEAAKIDGAGYFRTFFTIVMPNIKPAWLTVFLFAFRDMWSLAPAGVIFDEQIKTIPMIMNQISSGGLARQGCTMAAATIMMIPPIIVYLSTQSRVIETMSSAGIKD